MEFLVSPTKRVNDMGSLADFYGGRLPPTRKVCIRRRLNSEAAEASVILKMFMRTYSAVHNTTDWIQQPSRWFFKTGCRAMSRSRFPWALSTRNNAGATDGRLEGYRVANSSVGGFWKADPLSNCNSSVTGFLRRIGRDPIAASQSLF